MAAPDSAVCGVLGAVRATSMDLANMACSRPMPRARRISDVSRVLFLKVVFL
jgi:hypothetical protein